MAKSKRVMLKHSEIEWLMRAVRRQPQRDRTGDTAMAKLEQAARTKLPEKNAE